MGLYWTRSMARAIEQAQMGAFAMALPDSGAAIPAPRVNAFATDGRVRIRQLATFGRIG